jgi:hypothetical protein
VRVLVCGGRDYRNRVFLFDTLDCLRSKTDISLLIEGGARGADRLAKEWAGFVDVPVQEFRADWNRYDKAAGHIRNKQMLDEGRPDLVIAFPGGAGTADMIRQAEERRVEVMQPGSTIAKARIEAHRAFDPLWKFDVMSRDGAYEWLARKMNLSKDACHIGLFDETQCAQVVEVCASFSIDA